MNLFGEMPPRCEPGDLAGRVRALEEYVEYLRQQGEYGFLQLDKALERDTAQS